MRGGGGRWGGGGVCMKKCAKLCTTRTIDICSTWAHKTCSLCTFHEHSESIPQHSQRGEEDKDREDKGADGVC